MGSSRDLTFREACYRIYQCMPSSFTLSQQQVKQFVDACDKVGLDPAIVAGKAKLNWEGTILQSQLPLLRDAFTILKTGA